MMAMFGGIVDCGNCGITYACESQAHACPRCGSPCHRDAPEPSLR